MRGTATMNLPCRAVPVRESRRAASFAPWVERSWCVERNIGPGRPSLKIRRAAPRARIRLGQKVRESRQFGFALTRPLDFVSGSPPPVTTRRFRSPMATPRWFVCSGVAARGPWDESAEGPLLEAHDLVLKRNRPSCRERLRAHTAGNGIATLAQDLELLDRVWNPFRTERRCAGGDSIDDMKVQVRFSGVAGVSDERQHLAALHRVAHLHATSPVARVHRTRIGRRRYRSRRGSRRPSPG